MIFLGTYQHSVDIKNRISLPSKFFEKLSAEIYISKGFDGCLEIRNEKEFKEYVDGILSHSNTNANVRQVQRVFLSNTTKVEIDSSKRVLVPSYLLKEASITKDVTVIGVGDKIELWNADTYTAYLEKANQTYEEAAEKIYDDKK